ncbi:MAG: 2-C-methyl-D-erythritol 2,4-cyclodiphosphate synthase [Candidatus Omnitrophica bacterium]|nr:2-C-methyl-D-erythritol 2,4-cyclodiphosphate synthase [Candidatus Omnitrophota bacterium]
MEYRVGFGYDVHRLSEGRKLFLGGIQIPHLKGLLGHSDADVLLHALCDALLGALSLGDIGEHFPDTDLRYQGISSLKLLEQVNNLIKEKGFYVNNIDAVIVAQEPNLAPFKKEMRKTIAAALNIEEDAVGIKAKTGDGLGETGRKEAIAAYVIVSVNSRK